MLVATAPAELAPMRVDLLHLRKWVGARQYALQAAALDDGRSVLSRLVETQTHLAIGAILAVGLYFLWRGFVSERSRGWTDFFWIVGIGLAFFAPTFAPELTPQRVDYATAFMAGLQKGEALADFGRHGPRFQTVAPEAVMAARALLAAGAGVFLALCAHDLGYRLQEALLEFGLIGEDAKETGRRPFDRRSAHFFGTRESGPHESEKGDETQGFGHRDPFGPRADSQTARACATLGVKIGASRREIERAYRTKMKTAHPDHGGSVERATALNQARDLLLPHV